MTWTKKQMAAAKKIVEQIADEIEDFSVPTPFKLDMCDKATIGKHIATLLARAEAAEAERDRLRAALEDLTIGTAPPAWGSAEADDELGPVWREAQAEMTSRAAAVLAGKAGQQ